jgi:lysozyme family protein
LSDFRPAFEFMIRHEGGYVNDPNDAGGETKWGVSKRSYPDLDIASLTQEDAAQIYQRDFWQPQPYCHIDDQRIANKVFDMSVNMGSHQAHVLLQRAVNGCGQKVVADGVLGPLTLTAVNLASPDALLDELREHMGKFYYELAARRPSNQKFLNGWMNRANA